MTVCNGNPWIQPTAAQLGGGGGGPGWKPKPHTIRQSSVNNNNIGKSVMKINTLCLLTDIYQSCVNVKDSRILGELFKNSINIITILLRNIATR